jgi:hypothetical protein
MKVVPRFRDLLGKISVALVSELDQICLRINDWSSHEHNATGTHEAITVTSITFKTSTGTTILNASNVAATITANASTGQILIPALQPWEGKIVVCAGNGDPTLALATLLAGSLAPTGTNIGTTTARVSYFRLAVALTVVTVRWYAAGNTTAIFHIAVYRASDHVRMSADLNPDTTADTWGSVAAAFTLAADTTYYVAVTADTASAVNGFAALGTTVAALTGIIQVVPTSWPGGLQITRDPQLVTPYAFANVAVTAGVLPDPGLAPTAQIGWTGGMPAIFLDSE